MRKLNYLLTEFSSYFFIKVCLAIVICIVALCSIQFFQAYQEFATNTKMVNQGIGENSSFRLLDIEANRVSNADTANLILEAENLFDTNAYYFLGSSSFLADASRNRYYTENPIIYSTEGEELVSPNSAIMNRSLMEKANLMVSEGDFFSDDDFSGESKGILLGHAYQDQFQVGEEIIFKDIESVTEKNEFITSDKTYQVRGFLPQNLEILDFWQGSTDTLNMDEMIIFPLSDDILSDQEMTLQLQILGYFFLVSPEVNKQLSYLELSEQIRELGQKYGFDYLRLQNDRSIYNYEIQQYQLVYQNRLAILGLLLIFSLFQVGLIIIFTYEKREPIYEIYFSIGSTKRELFQILLGEYVLVFAFGFALLFLFNTFYLKEVWDTGPLVVGVLSYFVVFMLIVALSIGRKMFKNGNYFRREQ